MAVRRKTGNGSVKPEWERDMDARMSEMCRQCEKYKKQRENMTPEELERDYQQSMKYLNRPVPEKVRRTVFEAVRKGQVFHR